MKRKTSPKIDDNLLPDYDPELIRSGVRGKYAERYKASARFVSLAPDVAEAFPDADSVNSALRLLMHVASTAVTKPKRSTARAQA